MTVTGITASDKVYDGNTSATLNLGSAALSGAVAGDEVLLDTDGASGTFESANVGTWTVTISGLDLNGTDAGNYTLTQPTTTAALPKLRRKLHGRTPPISRSARRSAIPS